MTPRHGAPVKPEALFFQVEPNTKLFPAVFVQPLSQNMVQLELGKLKVGFFHVRKKEEGDLC